MELTTCKRVHRQEQNACTCEATTPMDLTLHDVTNPTRHSPRRFSRLFAQFYHLFVWAQSPNFNAYKTACVAASIALLYGCCALPSQWGLWCFDKPVQIGKSAARIPTVKHGRRKIRVYTFHHSSLSGAS